MQYELIGENNGINKMAGKQYTTYVKKSWDANQRLVQPDILVESSFDIETVIDFKESLLDKTSPDYAQEKQRLLDIFLEEYTLGKVTYGSIF